MAEDALEVVKLRKDFYRDSYRKLAMGLLLSIFINVILILIITYQIIDAPKPTYFATTSDGKIIPLIPLDQPNLTDLAIRNWATTAATSIYTYTFLNYRDAFENNEQYFTTNGWQSFITQIQNNGILTAVQQKKLTVSASVAGAPVITYKGVVNGRYAWKVQVPIVVTYQSISDQITQNLLISMVIQRVSTLDSQQGVGIIEFVATQR